MSITLSATSPISGELNVSQNKEIAFRLIASSSTILLNTLSVTVDSNFDPSQPAMGAGVFINGWSGTIITNVLGTDYTIIVNRPIASPEYTQGAKITINISVQDALLVTYTPSYPFEIEFFGLKIPPIYSESLVLTALPGGWTTQISGTGTIPTFSASGMDTHPVAAGTSFIRKTAYGLNFTNGFLIDVTAEVPPGSVAPIKKMRVLRVFKGGVGLISVFVDFTTGELWLGDVSAIPPTNFRPGISGTKISFRLSIKGTSTTLTARLYAGLFSDFRSPLIQQTLGPSTTLGTSEDLIEIGSIDSGDADVRISVANILNSSDPDIFYTNTVINKLSRTFGELIGNEKVRLQLTDSINIDLGTDKFIDNLFIKNDSSGGGSVSAVNGDLSLSLAAAGSAIARFTNTFSGQRPSASDILFDVEVSSAIILNPPQQEIILAAIDIGANGTRVALEMVSSIVDGTFFRIVVKEGATTTISHQLIKTNQNMHQFRIIRLDTSALIFANGQRLFTAVIGGGSGILRTYMQAAFNVVATTKFRNMKVRPVVKFGENIVTTPYVAF